MRSLSDSTHDAIATGVITTKLEIVEKNNGGLVSNAKEIAKSNALKAVDTLKNTQPPTAITEINFKGQQITIQLSLDGGKTYGCASYIHQATRYRGLDIHITEFSGVAVSWKLNRRIKNNRYTNLTLKGLAQKIARIYNMDLIMSVLTST